MFNTISFKVICIVLDYEIRTVLFEEIPFLDEQKNLTRLIFNRRYLVYTHLYEYHSEFYILTHFI